MKTSPISFTLTVQQKGRTDKTYTEKATYEYIDANYMKIEGMIRDIVKSLADRFTEEEYYP